MSVPGLVRILVVDDEPQIRKLLDIGLRSQGYAVQTAENGRTALAALATQGADLLILDLGLPDLDGHAPGRTTTSPSHSASRN